MKKVLGYLTNLWYTLIENRDDTSKRSGVINMKGLTILDVANYFSSKEEMSTKKIQKLVYYSYAWYIALNNKDKEHISNRLFRKCRFEAWVHGPVNPSLYSHYNGCYGLVLKYTGEINPLITGEIKQFLDSIYETFGKYTGDELEVMTHKEMPWQNARDTLPPYAPSKKEILEEDMFVYYNSL